jgi:hypothetical protein
MTRVMRFYVFMTRVTLLQTGKLDFCLFELIHLWFLVMIRFINGYDLNHDIGHDPIHDPYFS